MVVRFHPAVDAQPPDARSNLVALRDDHPAITIAAKILRRKKAQGSDGRCLTGHHPLAVDLATSANGLRRVLDDRDIPRRVHDHLDRRHLAEQVDWNDCLSRRFDRRCNGLSRDVERVGIDIGEHDFRANVVRRSRRGKKRERCGQDFVASTNI